MKKCAYIHGAFSAFKPNSEKVKGLKKEYEVVGISYSMENRFEDNLNMLVDFCKKENVDFVVGTSLGGLYSAEINKILDIPAVLINPCIEPVMSLSKIVGTQKNFTTGQDEVFTQELADEYPKLSHFSRNMLICLGMKDELIDSNRTLEIAREHTEWFVIDDNEDHYWEFWEQNKVIEKFLTSPTPYTTVCNDNVIDTAKRLLDIK